MSYDSVGTNTALALLVGSGAWAWLPRRLRRWLLHHDSEHPAEHHLAVSLVRGRERTTLDLVDPHGRAHLVAAGTVSQVERLLGRDRTSPPLGVSHPEQADDVARDLAALREMGVVVQAERNGSAG